MRPEGAEGGADADPTIGSGHNPWGGGDLVEIQPQCAPPAATSGLAMDFSKMASRTFPNPIVPFISILSHCQEQ